jgi:hypothetical protein
MHRGYRYFSSFVLTAALAAPVAMMAAASPQDDRNHENRERSYQRYQTERHEKRAFVQLNTRHQSDYWNWRHSNPDNR